MSAFFSKAASNERRLPEHSLYLKKGIPRRGEQCPIVIFSYIGYSPPKIHMQWYNTNIHIPYNLRCTPGMIYFMHENVCHARTPSHPPTPSHKPMPSVKIVTGNANDTHYQAFTGSPTPKAICQWVAIPSQS